MLKGTLFEKTMHNVLMILPKFPRFWLHKVGCKKPFEYNAMSIFNVKLYKLFFFGTEETVDLDIMERATFDVKIQVLLKIV